MCILNLNCFTVFAFSKNALFVKMFKFISNIFCCWNAYHFTYPINIIPSMNTKSILGIIYIILIYKLRRFLFILMSYNILTNSFYISCLANFIKTFMVIVIFNWYVKRIPIAFKTAYH